MTSRRRARTQRVDARIDKGCLLLNWTGRPHGCEPTCTPSSTARWRCCGIVASRHLAFRLARISNCPPGAERVLASAGHALAIAVAYRRWLCRPQRQLELVAG
jgi:hypothetical protein